MFLSSGARIRPWRRAALGVALALAASGCTGVLDPVGPVGADDARILIDATVIMLAIVVPTILLAFWMAWRYRASNKTAEYLPYWSYSGRIEAVVWSIPILTIMFIGGGGSVGAPQPPPPPPPAPQNPKPGGGGGSPPSEKVVLFPPPGGGGGNHPPVPPRPPP